MEPSLGKSAPTPPPAPNPTQVAQAQTASNQQTALYQSQLNNTNIDNPYGSVDYSYNPSANQWTQTTTPSPGEQEVVNNSLSDQAGALAVANQQIGKVANALDTPLSTPSFQTSAPVGSLQTSYNPGGSIEYGFNPGGSIQSQVAPTYSPFSGTGLPGTNPYGTGASPGGLFNLGGASMAQGSGPIIPGATTMSPSSSGSGSASSDGLTNAQIASEFAPGFANAQGHSQMSAYDQWLQSGQSALPQAQQQVYNQLAQQDPNYNQQQLDLMSFQPNLGANGQQFLQSLGGTQGSSPSAGAGSATPVTPQAAAQPSAGAQSPQGQGPQWNYNPSSAASQMAPGPSSTAAQIASNPVLGTQLASYDQATQLLNPQWQQATEQEQAQLVSQGLNPNDAAYQNAMTLFGNQENEAYDQAAYNAIGAGDAEQNTLFGQNLSAGQFANAAQAQQYGENQGEAALNNTAQAQANSQNLQAATFNNTALGQNFNEQSQNAQLANQSAQQAFQNSAYAQELPINEFDSLASSGQVALPASAPAQTSVAPTNVLGAYQLQQTALQNAYEAQMQNYASGLGGLFNLGAAALTL